MRTLQSELLRLKLGKKKKQHERAPKKKRKTDLSRREIEELMGTRRQTYRRVNGAFRAKRGR